MKECLSVTKKTILIFGILMLPKISLAQEAMNLQKVATEQFDTARRLLDVIMEFAVKYSFQVIGGVIVLILGWLFAGFLCRFVKNFFDKKEVDVTVTKFVVAGVKITIMAFAGIVALGKFGIEIAPLIAGISVIGFGASFALQGPLSNFAAGVTLIFTKPFKVGDIIEVAGVNGEVLDLKLPRTEIKTVDGNLVVVPNKHIIGEIIHNYTQFKRVDISVGVSYSANVKEAIEVVKKTIVANEKVYKSKEPKVGIQEFGDSSVNIYARLWCKQDDYWEVLFGINQSIFDVFKKKGIEIPFPQRDVHMVK